MNRRHLLTIGGSCIVAGCLGSGSDNDTDPDERSDSNTSASNDPDDTDSGPADLLVQDISAPPEAEIYETVEVQITIKNEGGEFGQGEAAIDVGSETRYLQVDLEPGESESYSLSVQRYELEEITAQLDSRWSNDVRGADVNETVVIRPLLTELGDSVTTETDHTIQITDIYVTNSYEKYSDWYGEIRTIEPEEGELFAVVEVSCTNAAAGSQRLPDHTEFIVEENDGEIADRETNPLLEVPDFRGDLEDKTLYQSEFVPPGSSTSGIIIFEVRSSSELRAGWQSPVGTPDQTLYWV